MWPAPLQFIVMVCVCVFPSSVWGISFKSAAELRRACRSNTWTGPTAGEAPGYVPWTSSWWWRETRATRDSEGKTTAEIRLKWRETQREWWECDTERERVMRKQDFFSMPRYIDRFDSVAAKLSGERKVTKREQKHQTYPIYPEFKLVLDDLDEVQFEDSWTPKDFAPPTKRRCKFTRYHLLLSSPVIIAITFKCLIKTTDSGQKPFYCKTHNDPQTSFLELCLNATRSRPIWSSSQASMRNSLETFATGLAWGAESET